VIALNALKVAAVSFAVVAVMVVAIRLRLASLDNHEKVIGAKNADWLLLRHREIIAFAAVYVLAGVNGVVCALIAAIAWAVGA
jgi:hypothetical protein